MLLSANANINAAASVAGFAFVGCAAGVVGVFRDRWKLLASVAALLNLALIPVAWIFMFASSGA